MSDGFVKNPSAALRFTPALLDQKLGIEGIGRGSDFQEEDSFWDLSHRVNRCSVPGSTLHSSGFARLASGAFYETIILMTFYEIIMSDPLKMLGEKGVKYAEAL
jgi:hypothetical protein